MLIEPDDRLNVLAGKVIGVAIEVHRLLGPGYMEKAYERALAIEMLERGIGFEQQYKFWIDYKDQKVGLGYIDFLVEKSLVVELKSSRQLQDLHRAQLISYLKATGCQLGLLLNFKSPTMKDGIERIIYSTR